jgi:hypothetical protein
MIRLVLVLFIILHGLVHLLYAGQARRLFELRPGLVWPDDSWLLSGRLDAPAVRNLAGLLYVLAAAGFVLGGIGLLIGQPWSRTVVVASALLSTGGVLLFWDGTAQKLPDQGLIAVLINIGLAALFLLQRVPE